MSLPARKSIGQMHPYPQEVADDSNYRANEDSNSTEYQNDIEKAFHRCDSFRQHALIGRCRARFADGL